MSSSKKILPHYSAWYSFLNKADPSNECTMVMTLAREAPEMVDVASTSSTTRRSTSSRRRRTAGVLHRECSSAVLLGTKEGGHRRRPSDIDRVSQILVDARTVAAYSSIDESPYYYCKKYCYYRWLLSAVPRHSSSSRRIRQVRWVVGSVCLFVTLQFLCTLRMYLVLSEHDSNLEEHSGQHYHDHHQVAFFNPPMMEQQQVVVVPPNNHQHQRDGGVVEAIIDVDSSSSSSMQQIHFFNVGTVGTTSLRGTTLASNSDIVTNEELFEIVFGGDHPDTPPAPPASNLFLPPSLVMVANDEEQEQEQEQADQAKIKNQQKKEEDESSSSSSKDDDDAEESFSSWSPHSPDYGGLQFSFDLVPGSPRVIREEEDSTTATIVGSRDSSDDKEDQEEEQATPITNGGQDEYYAFDDDWVRGQAVDDNNSDCRRISEHRLAFSNCNEFHQMHVSPDGGGDSGGGGDSADGSAAGDFSFINHGGYRQVFSYTHRYRSTTSNGGFDKVAMKEIIFKDIGASTLDEDSDMQNLEFVRMDAVVAERLTASPRIYDIYGYCGLSILSEYFHHGDIEQRSILGRGNSNNKNNKDHGRIRPKQDLHDEQEQPQQHDHDDVDDVVHSQNNLTATQKLVLALEMAEGLADLHGYSHGLIIHDDVQLSQFLLNQDRTRLKLNDFNRAEFPLWNDKRQEYCRYENGHGHGDWRSPEEYKDEPLTEAIDVWSLGNNLVGLLTGLRPFYELNNNNNKTAGGRRKHGSSTRRIWKRVIQGETTFIDPRYMERSPEESALVKIIQRCFEYAPEDRPTIFDVVQYLQEAVSELVERKGGISRQSVLQQL